MNIMKKSAFSLTLIIISVFFICSCTNAKTPAKKTLYQPKEGEIAACFLDKSSFQAFLINPSADAFSNYIAYRKSPGKEGYIEQEVFSENGEAEGKFENTSGYFRISSWPVYTEFIDFMNDDGNFKKILSDHSIEGEILSCIAMEYQYLSPETDKQTPIPPGTLYTKMCIWIHTASGDYFLENNPYLAPSPTDTNFTYDFYDLAEYTKKYGNLSP